MIKHDNQKLKPNTEDYHFEVEKIRGSEIKEISSQQNNILFVCLITFVVCPTKIATWSDASFLNKNRPYPEAIPEFQSLPLSKNEFYLHENEEGFLYHLNLGHFPFIRTDRPDHSHHSK